MDKLRMYDYDDFYFNGHWLSEFGGIVGGTNRMNVFPLLPAKNMTTAKAIRQDGEYLFATQFQPRTFDIPVFFFDLSSIGMREIAGWLNTKKPSKLMFKNEDLYINCMLDSSAYSINTIVGFDGAVTLKFIAYDPFFYKDNVKTYYFSNELTSNNLTIFPLSTTNTITLENECNINVFPTIIINGTGNVTMYIKGNNEDGSEIKTGFAVKCSNGCVLDTYTHEILDVGSLTKYTGEFYTLDGHEYINIPKGSYKVSFGTVDSTITQITMSYKERYI